MRFLGLPVRLFVIVVGTVFFGTVSLVISFFDPSAMKPYLRDCLDGLHWALNPEKNKWPWPEMFSGDGGIM
jgi:hypothetical protein